MKNVKIYGDSILKGVVYNEELGRYKINRYDFSDIVSSGLTVANESKMGATVGKGLEIMKATLGDDESDTLVVLEYGGNDCNYDWKAVSENPKGEFLCATPEEEFIKTYGEMIDFARSKGAKVAVCTLVPIDSDKFMEWISKGLDRANILSWLGGVSMLGRWQEYYSRLSESIAKIAKCPIIDLRSSFLCRRGLGEYICADGMHPNERGHKIISDALQKALLAI